MIKFFRKIRQSLLSEGKTGKYLKYAVGEIVLVVIGILIALSINNWNEEKKDRHTERSFLEGIKGDIESDLSEIDQIIDSISTRLTTFKAVDPDYRLDFSTQELSIDTTKVSVYVLLGSSRPFYSTSDAYNSLITVGKSNLIKNIQLFQNIQKLYDNYKTLDNINSRAYERSDDISLKYSYEKRYWTFKELIEKSDKKLIADLAYLQDVYRLYLRNLKSSKDQMKQILREIEIELK